MPLGTLDRTPPPFFRQGPSALTKLAFFSALAVFLMAADTRFQFTQPLRAAIATALLPLQRALLVPVGLAAGAGEHAQGLQAARAAELAARTELARQSVRATQVDRLTEENARLRAMLELRPLLTVRSVAAEVMYQAADPYSRKLFIDRGTTQGVQLGAPVVNESGVVGQVTRVYPLTSVLTLVTLDGAQGERVVRSRGAVLLRLDVAQCKRVVAHLIPFASLKRALICSSVGWATPSAWRALTISARSPVEIVGANRWRSSGVVSRVLGKAVWVGVGYYCDRLVTWD